MSDRNSNRKKSADSAQALAKRLLSERLRAVSRWLKKARRPVSAEKRSEDSVEAVHQLRVATRRALAATWAFRDWLPPKHAKWIERRLESLRKSAGETREWDALAKRLADWSDPPSPSDRRALIEWTVRQAEKSRREIERSQRTLRDKRFSKRTKGLVRKLKWRGAGDPPAAARMAEFAIYESLAPWLDDAKKRTRSPQTLHALRVRGKQARYIIDMFQGYLPKKAATLALDLLENMQDRLGAINDRVVSKEIMADVPSRIHAAAEAWLASEAKGLQTDLSDYYRWFTAKRRGHLAATLEQLTKSRKAKGRNATTRDGSRSNTKAQS